MQSERPAGAIERHGSGAPWEEIVGYSRVVRAGPLVEVAGTAAVGEDGQVLALGDAAGQTREALALIERALERVGASLADVVRTRIYVTDISCWEEIGRAHGEVFAENRPVSAMIEVTGFIDPRMLVEIEATAWVADWA